RQIRDTLETRVRLVEVAIRNVGRDRLQARVTALAEEDPRGLRISLLDDRGRVLADSAGPPDPDDNQGDRPEIAAARQSAIGRHLREERGGEMMYVAKRTDSSPAAFVRVALPTDQIREQFSELRQAVITSALVAAAAALAVTTWLARRIARPIE